MIPDRGGRFRSRRRDRLDRRRRPRDVLDGWLRRPLRRTRLRPIGPGPSQAPLRCRTR